MPVNIKNPAIKRIHADVRELMKDPSDQYYAAPLEDNLFEWHFTIRGPPDTEFAGGVYHGRILLPPDYPFRPPDIVFVTPNGRFKAGVKVCLTISSYHPEHWQPAWGIRLILEALISFFPTPSQGALGGLDWTPEERKQLAYESNKWKCYKCGLSKDLLPELQSNGPSKSKSSCFVEQIRELHKLKAKTAEEVEAEASPAAAAEATTRDDSAETLNPNGSGDGNNAASTALAGEARNTTASSVRTPDLERSGETASGSEEARNAGSANPERDEDREGEAAPGEAASAVASTSTRNASEGVGRGENATREGGKTGDDDFMLSLLAVAIVAAILWIVLRKMMRYLGEF